MVSLQAVLLLKTALSGLLVVTGVLFGFITKFWHALALRAIEGIFNGNVAIARTMISEVVKEKKFVPRNLSCRGIVT